VAHIFVSYTSSDRDWAHWIALELESLGHVAHVHEWEIEGSESIYAWMEMRHDAADRVLCVVSDEYLKAPYSTQERHAALWQAASKRPGFVLLVAVRPCKFPTLSDHLRRCELLASRKTRRGHGFGSSLRHPSSRSQSRSPARSRPSRTFRSACLSISLAETRHLRRSTGR